MKYSEQVRKDSKAAADYIRKHGWCQGTTREFDGGPCCALGAVWSVCGSLGGFNTEELERAIKSEIDGSIPNWNDAKGRTKEEVIAVFERIANS